MYDDTREWMQRAACLCADPELFFPVSETGPSQLQISQAKQICHACPVQRMCLAWALQHSVTDGIWGGTTQGERHALLRAGRVFRRAPGRPADKTVSPGQSERGMR